MYRCLALQCFGLVFFLFVAFATGCNESSSSGSDGKPDRDTPRIEQPTGKISTGSMDTLASELVNHWGKTITIDTPDHPLDGLRLHIPDGAYEEPRQFTVSSFPITDHTFGEHFNPLTPLIQIENGGEYADEILTVDIPINLPPGHFAMPFYYDDNTGTLEGIPFVDLRQDTVTVYTRRFSKLVMSSIAEDGLNLLIEQGLVDSGFRPGIDDWQFPNYGSYIAPGGHCSGQAVSAMWYFVTNPDGPGSRLWGRYDNNGRIPGTPDIWEDDSHAYRFVSTVHRDGLDRSTQFERWFRNFAMDVNSDRDNYLATAYSIFLSGHPQYVRIDSWLYGHVLVAYRVSEKGIHVADPNYPGDGFRLLAYENNTFLPYVSATSTGEIEQGNTDNFNKVGFFGKTALYDWEVIAARWGELKSGTIGNDRFPQYTIRTLGNDGKPILLKDGHVSNKPGIKILVTSPDTTIGFINVYRDGMPIEYNQNFEYELEEGENHIGIAIYGDANNDPRNREYRYVDFVYINIEHQDKPDLPFDCGWDPDYSSLRKIEYGNGMGFFHENQRWLKHGLEVVFYDPEQNVISGALCYYEGKVHGRAVNFHENGAMRIQQTFYHGERHGLLTSWTHDGFKHQEGMMTHGEQTGIWYTRLTTGSSFCWNYDIKEEVPCP